MSCGSPIASGSKNGKPAGWDPTRAGFAFPVSLRCAKEKTTHGIRPYHRNQLGKSAMPPRLAIRESWGYTVAATMRKSSSSRPSSRESPRKKAADHDFAMDVDSDASVTEVTAAS